jgi:hypothetical protein
VAERGCATDPGRRVGRAQRSSPAARLREVHRRPRPSEAATSLKPPSANRSRARQSATQRTRPSRTNLRRDHTRTTFDPCMRATCRCWRQAWPSTST